MRGKRELAARASAWVGFTSVLENLPQRRVLMILTYHRIGNAEDTPFDSNVFSATAEELDAQIAYFKRRFHMATLEEALAMNSGHGPRGTSVLITFDDGYLDNYNLAFPILRSHGVQGVFFLPTAFRGDRQAALVGRDRLHHQEEPKPTDPPPLSAGGSV